MTKKLLPSAIGATRRSFLKGSAAAALGTAFVPGFLSSSAYAAFQGRLSMLAWDFQPSTIRELVDSWTAKGNPAVDLAIIPNLGYSPAIQTRLRGGDKVDIYYNFDYNTQKFVEQGWASKLNGLPQVDQMIADMLESARVKHVTADGDIISVPYFSAVYALLYNQKYLADAGLAKAPSSLQEIYEASKKLKASGVTDTPYVAFWVKEFCEQYLLSYLLNEDIEIFDAAGKPVFAEDPKTLGVLEWWQKMYQEDLTPRSVLTDDPNLLSNQMAQGSAAFYVMHHYFLTTTRSINGPQSANVVMAPGTSAHTLQIGEVLQLGQIDDEERRMAAWNLAKYYGWKDEEGHFTVFTQWAKAGGLAAPYAGFFTDPAVIAAFPDYYDLGLLSDMFANRSKVVPARTLRWYSDFQVKVGDIIHTLLLNQATPQQTLDALVGAVKASQSGPSL